MNLIEINFIELSPRTYHSETSSPTASTIKLPDPNVSRCSPIPPLKLNAAQYYRSNPDNGDAFGAYSKDNHSSTNEGWHLSNDSESNLSTFKKTRKRSSKKVSSN